MSKVEQASGAYFIQTWPRVAKDGVSELNVLDIHDEYETLVRGRVILGSKKDVTRASTPCEKEVHLDSYSDTNLKRGRQRGTAVLVSMEDYKHGYRWGGAVDRGRLESTASNLSLNLQGNIFLDFKAHDLRNAMVDLAQACVPKEDECFVCFVNAHGGTSATDGAFFFTDCHGDQIYLLNDMVEPFRKCKNLLGKPKIFLSMHVGVSSGWGARMKLGRGPQPASS